MILQFSPKDPDEIIVLTMDFSNLLNGGESIVSAVVKVTETKTGADMASAMLDGGADITGAPLVRQQVKAGADGSVYLVRMLSTTSSGRVLVGGAHLPVHLGA